MGLSDLIMNSYSKTSRLMQRGCDFLGSETAILCGAMSWVSERNLVSAISNAGGFGVIACGAMTPELLDTDIEKLTPLQAINVLEAMKEELKNR